MLSHDAFSDFGQGLKIDLVTDSQVTMHFVRKMASKSSRILQGLPQLHARCETLDVTIEPSYLPSVLNFWADKLSRQRERLFFSPRPVTLARLERRVTYTVHNFADGPFTPVLRCKTSTDYRHPLKLE